MFQMCNYKPNKLNCIPIFLFAHSMKNYTKLPGNKYTASVDQNLAGPLKVILNAGVPCQARQS